MNLERRWDIFESEGRDEIQRVDDIKKPFHSDWEAIGYVVSRAAGGSEVHREALLHCYPELIKEQAAVVAKED